MKRQFVAMLVAGLLAACMMLLADTRVDYNHSTDFSKFRTYSWIKVQASNQIWQERVKHDVDAALQSRGWQQVASGGDAGVTAFGSTKEQKSIQTFYDGLGGGWGWGGFGGEATTNVVDTPEGTLVVDIFDHQTKKLVWRSVATNSLSGDPDKNAKKLEKTVEDMFKHFPPKAKG